MARPLRNIEPGQCYHVLNCGNLRQMLFAKDQDYQAFIRILTEAVKRFDVELLCWCIMPNHWHLVLRPRRKGAMEKFMAWLTMTHVRRHHEHIQSARGHLYQGRYKSFPVKDDEHFLILCRYVEANPRRAKLVQHAQQWKWSSLHQRDVGDESPRLYDWPMDRPMNWVSECNAPIPSAITKSIRASVERGRPFGPELWVRKVANRHGLEQTLRSPHRPRKSLSQLSKRGLQRRAREANGI